MTKSELTKRFHSQLREANLSEAATELDILFSPKNPDPLTAEEMANIGRAIRKSLPVSAPKVLVLGQCTTTWLSDTLAAVGWQKKTRLAVEDGPYDNVLQYLGTLTEKNRPDLLVLIPWSARLLDSDQHRKNAESLDGELAFWRQAWTQANRLGIKIIQIGYDSLVIGPRGLNLEGNEGGHLHFVRKMNSRLRLGLPPGAYFLDLERVAGDVGRQTFYDPRRYAWTKQPFSELGTFHLAQVILAGIKTLIAGPKKVLVLDLDNTLWGGIVGEEGYLGVSVGGNSPDGEAFSAFQRYVKGLRERGILLAVCSKNNPEDAAGPFRHHPEMILKATDFVAIEASWDPKSQAIQRISEHLKLGLHSFVFFDDNPVERHEVKRALPEVEVVEVPEEPADYIRALEAGLHFETLKITAEDGDRTEQYQTEIRRQAVSPTGSIEDFLTSLHLIATLSPIAPDNEADLPRVVQLLQKSNQFNLTSRRHSQATVEQLVAKKRTIAFAVRLKDKFGDYGLISLMIAVAESPDQIRIDSWVMSCRVIGRTVEQFTLRHLCEVARQMGYREVIGEFVPSDKNALVKELFPRMGFESLEAKANFFKFSLEKNEIPPTFIEDAAANLKLAA